MAGPSSHNRLSPSGASRWLACPYSAQDDLPDTSNEKTRAGTIQHDWASEVLLGNCSIESVPQQIRPGIEMYVNYVQSFQAEHPLIERNWQSLTIPDLGGTIDATILEDRTCWVIDFKSGDFPIEPDNNTQLMTYAAILSEHFVVDRFQAAIVQPTAGGVKEASYSVEQVDELRERIRIAAVSDEKNPGYACRFCPLRLHNMCAEGVLYGWGDKGNGRPGWPRVE